MRRRLDPARAASCRRASVLLLRTSRALTWAGFDKLSSISTVRPAPCPRTRIEARAVSAASGWSSGFRELSEVAVGAVVVPAGEPAVAVGVVVVGSVGRVVVVGSGGTLTVGSGGIV